MPSLHKNHNIMWQKLGVVTPWYGHQFGGAERFIRQFAEQLAQHSFTVEVFTTCCSSPYVEWSTNDLPEGKTEINNLLVHRFPADRRDADTYAQIYRRLSDVSSGGISREQEELLIANSIHSQALYDFIRHNKDEYIWIFAPYMYGTTIAGSQIAPERTLIFPCLHDEPFATLNSVKKVFQNVRGILCLSPPEKELILRLYGLDSASVHYVGCGVSRVETGNPVRFREKFQITEPYFLYLGKKDIGKNLHILIPFFEQFAQDFRFNGKLVLIGPGDTRWVCEHINERYIIDLGVLNDETYKNDALAGAVALCHPSNKESFSIVIMESWLQQRPVVVDYYCDVTRHHCEQSNGGLYYRNYWEFFECLKLLITRPDIASILGKQGKDYVEKEFNWHTVIKRFITALQHLFP